MTRRADGFEDEALAVGGELELGVLVDVEELDEDFATTQGYIREAEAVREGFGDIFPPLPSCLLQAPEGAPSEGGEDAERPPTPGNRPGNRPTGV